MTREYWSRFECAEPGCTEHSNFTSRTRAEQAETYRNYYGKWRCTRHSRPDELLTLQRRKITSEIVSDERPHGVYWGNNGFVFGPGFKAFSKDFPPGTTLRVTAEVILPTPEPSHAD